MAVPAAEIVFTVQDAMIACGIDNVTLFDGSPPTTRIATNLFDDDFTACMEKTYKDLDDDLKGYSILTQAQGQIRLTPGTKKNLKAFVQWTRYRIRLGQDPAGIDFPPQGRYCPTETIQDARTVCNQSQDAFYNGFAREFYIQDKMGRLGSLIQELPSSDLRS